MRPRMVDVSQGRKWQQCQLESSTQNIVDIQWLYLIDRVSIDTWSLAGDPVETEVVEAFAQSAVVLLSENGMDWKSFAIEWSANSQRSTPGDGPSWVGVFNEPVQARFVSIEVSGGFVAPYGLRVFSPLGTLTSDEHRKHTVADESISRSSADFGVVVVGGSNSVMRYGWRRALNQSPTRVEATPALGASSNIFVARTLKEYPSPKASYLLINANVTEYNLMKQGDYDFELADDAIAYALSYSNKHDLFPISVIWPQRGYLEASFVGDDDWAPDAFFVSQARKFSISYIDGYRLLFALADRIGRSPESLFLDRDHLNHFAAQVIGRAISHTLGELTSSGIFDLRNRSTSRVRSLSVINSSAFALRSHKVHVARSRLIIEPTVQLASGQSIRIPVPEGWEVVGYALNARYCDGAIEISGQNTIARLASFAGYDPSPGASPFVCVRPLPEPVIPEGGHVLVTGRVPCRGDIQDELFQPFSEDITTDGTIALGYLITRSVEHSEFRSKLDSRDLDLTPLVVNNFFQDSYYL